VAMAMVEIIPTQPEEDIGWVCLQIYYITLDVLLREETEIVCKF